MLILSNTGAVGVSWSDWDEVTETGSSALSNDQNSDGTEDTFFVLGNATAPDNETGVGVVSGVDLVWTDVDNAPVNAGPPRTRTLNGIDDYFTVTQNFLDTLLSGTTFTIILKFTDTTGANGHTHTNINGATNKIYCRLDNGGGPWKMISVMESSVGASGNITSTDNFDTGAPVWICAWGDGSANSKCAWHTSKPTAISDFAANKTMDMGGVHNFSGNDWATTQWFFADNGPANYWEGSWQYTVVSNICLFS